MDLLKFDNAMTFVSGRKKRKNLGYTLIELIIAIAILNAGIAGSLFLLNQAARNTERVKNNFIASYLASEGIEIARNIRDINWRDGKTAQDESCQDWRAGLVNLAGCPLECGSGCGVDYTHQEALRANLADEPLRFDETSGSYQYANGTPTIFTRSIEAQKMRAECAGGASDACAIRVVSTVSWEERGGIRTKIMEEHLYNWKE